MDWEGVLNISTCTHRAHSLFWCPKRGGGGGGGGSPGIGPCPLSKCDTRTLKQANKYTTSQNKRRVTSICFKVYSTYFRKNLLPLITV